MPYLYKRQADACLLYGMTLFFCLLGKQPVLAFSAAGPRDWLGFSNKSRLDAARQGTSQARERPTYSIPPGAVYNSRPGRISERLPEPTRVHRTRWYRCRPALWARAVRRFHSPGRPARQMVQAREAGTRLSKTVRLSACLRARRQPAGFWSLARLSNTIRVRRTRWYCCHPALRRVPSGAR